MSRAQFVTELLNLWNESMKYMEREGYTRAANEMKIAISVLQRTYTQEELLPTDD